MPSLARPPRLPPRRQPLGHRRRRLPHRHAGAGAPAADAARSATRRPAWTRAASSAATAARRWAWWTRRCGRRASSSTRPASASCPRSTRSSPPRRCSARSASRPTPSAPAEGVFAMWYGKGPGVDRAGDALKHGNAYGASPHGGVLVVAGDDHGCVSSSMPHQSDQAFQAWHMPVRRAGQRRRVPRVRPVRLGAVALLGQLGRLHGAVGGGGERLDGRPRPDRTRASPPGRTAPPSPPSTGYAPPADGLHYRWPDLPSLKIEQRLHAKLDAVRAFARVNSHRPRHRRQRRAPRVGIVTAGKAHYDFMEVLRRLDIPLERWPPPACASTSWAWRIRSSRRACDAFARRPRRDAGRSRRRAGSSSSSCATCSTTRACGRRSSASATRSGQPLVASSASCGRRA